MYKVIVFESSLSTLYWYFFNFIFAIVLANEVNKAYNNNTISCQKQQQNVILLLLLNMNIS